MVTKRQCVCGQRFSSEGEQTRHQSYCEDFKRAQARAQLVMPLETELGRLAKDAEIIASDLAAAFDRLLDADSAQVAYHVDLAQRHLESTTIGLRSLADKVTEVAKNRYALIDRLRGQTTELIERLQRYEATVKKAQARFRPRSA